MTPLRIYNYIPTHDPTRTHIAPMSVNYKTGLSTRLAAVRTLVKGELRSVQFCDPETGEPVVLESRTYERNRFGLLQRRPMQIRYYTIDGGLSDQVKEFPKAYSSREAVHEIKRRRENMAEAAMAVALQQLGGNVANALPSLAKLSAAKTAFIESGNAGIIAELQQWSFNGWNDAIRDAVIEELTL